MENGRHAPQVNVLRGGAFEAFHDGEKSEAVRAAISEHLQHLHLALGGLGRLRGHDAMVFSFDIELLSANAGETRQGERRNRQIEIPSLHALYLEICRKKDSPPTPERALNWVAKTG